MEPQHGCHNPLQVLPLAALEDKLAAVKPKVLQVYLRLLPAEPNPKVSLGLLPIRFVKGNGFRLN